MMGLTPRQSETLTFIRNHKASAGVTPSYDEIATALGVKSRSNVHRCVHALIERGYLRHLPNRSRSIALVEDGQGGDAEGDLAFLSRRTGKTRDQLIAQAIDEFVLRQVRS